MENKISSAEELKTIRKIMEESSRFLSLSGLSGVFAGIIAIAGAFFAWFFILERGEILSSTAAVPLPENEISALKWRLATDGLIVLLLALVSALYFSARKARMSGKKLWSSVSKRMVINLSIPLAAGGIFAFILFIQGYFPLIIPVLLIFYGLALVNAGKFTYGEIFYLGLLEIVTGLLAAVYPASGLFFWVFGFGLLHIIYGYYMFRKYGA